MAGSGLQIGIVLSSVISLPFVARALTSAEYGVYATLLGFSALLVFADLGVGSALTNRLTSDEPGRETSLRRAISSALVVAVGAGAAVLLIGLWAAVSFSWKDILGADAIGDPALTNAVACSATITGIAIAGSLGSRVLYGVQRGRTANQWQLGGIVLAACCSIAAALLDAPLFVFVLTGGGCPALVAAACTAWTLWRTDLVPSPSLSAISIQEIGWLVKTGGWFFMIAVFSAAGYHTDILVVATTLGAPQAGVFSITMALFGIVTQSLYPALLQLWPALGDAYRRGDLRWIRSRLLWSTAVAVALSALAGTVLILFGRSLIAAWLTSGLVPPRQLLVVFAAWTCLSLASAPMMLFLNAIGRVRAHALMAALVGVVNLPLSIVLALQHGLIGPVLASLLAQFFFLVLPGSIVVARALRGRTIEFGVADAPAVSRPES